MAIVCVLALAASVGRAEFRADIEYGRADGERLLVDAYVPDGAGPFPVAILVHGGGWGGGDKAREHVPPTEPLSDAGFTWFSISYRLAPQHRWPACLEDVRTAIRWVKANAAKFKGDPERIALIGYSAGGHLVAYAAVTAEADTEVQAMVLLAGPTDLVADCERRGQVSPALQNLLGLPPELDDEARRALRAASPLTHVEADAPPCLLIHGTNDPSVPYDQSVEFKKRLDSLGVPCRLVTIPDGTHHIAEWNDLVPNYQQTMTRWLFERLASDAR